jgi:predicted RNase H-like nuclease (RuvC/YqgF family)
MSYNHAYVDSRQQDFSATGRWGIKAAGSTTAAAAQHSPTTGAYSAPALMREVSLLQEQVAHQTEQLEELYRELEERDAEGEELRQALNLERFRYELLVDLWSMRVLDNEELGLQLEQQHNGGHSQLR